MKKRIILKIDDSVVAFADSQDSTRLLAFPREHMASVYDKWKEHRDMNSIPIKYTIPVFDLGKVGENDAFTDDYAIISKTPFDFPMNRINWLMIQILHQKN